MIASANFLLGSQARNFEVQSLEPQGDLLPWADPYIAQLIDDHAAELAREEHGLRMVELRRSRPQARRVLAVAS